MHIFWNYTTDSSLKIPYVGNLVKHTFCSLYWNQKRFCKPEQREDNSKNMPMCRMSLAMSWRSGSFHLKTMTKKWGKKSTNFVMINMISWEVLMPSTKYAGLSYPTHLLKSRGSVIRNHFLEYRPIKATHFINALWSHDAMLRTFQMTLVLIKFWIIVINDLNEWKQYTHPSTCFIIV